MRTIGYQSRFDTVEEAHVVADHGINVILRSGNTFYRAAGKLVLGVNPEPFYAHLLKLVSSETDADDNVTAILAYEGCRYEVKSTSAFPQVPDDDQIDILGLMDEDLAVYMAEHHGATVVFGRNWQYREAYVYLIEKLVVTAALRFPYAYDAWMRELRDGANAYEHAQAFVVAWQFIEHALNTAKQ